MSLFDVFSSRKRKFKAALTLILAEYTYSQLSDEKRKKVDEAVVQVIAASGDVAPTLAYFAMPDEYRYGLIAAALKQLRIPPAVEGEEWSLMGNPFAVNFEDTGFDKAVEDAITYLQGKGVNLYPEEGENEPCHEEQTKAQEFLDDEEFLDLDDERVREGLDNLCKEAQAKRPKP